MNWSDIRVLYQREIRSALRERSIVMNGILVPIILYPLMMWLGFSGITFVQGLSSRETSRVALLDLPAVHSEIRDSLDAIEQVILRDDVESLADARTRIQQGELDAAVVFGLISDGGSGLPQNISTEIFYDASENRSRQARSRINAVVEDHRSRWFEDVALQRGASATDLAQFRVRRQNVATGGEMGALLLGVMIPMFLTIMVALGCLYPAIDSTAGERERSTWETTMTVAASRTSVVVAKYLYVATLGMVAGLLNVLAFTLSMGFIIAPLLNSSDSSFAFQLPWMAIPVMMAGSIALALFFSAAMMILASFARTFKDGTAMTMPVYWLALIPVVLGQSPDRQLDLTMALIPIANVAQMIKDAIQGTFAWGLIAISLVEALALVGVCLWIAARILTFEDHLMGSFDGSFWKFARERLLPGRRHVGARSGEG